ncbi:MAG: hypothetical protein AABX11_05665 [Nanoarchaeota archaeon]
MDLKDIKRDYAVMESKFSLPKFSEINPVFEIEKLEYESDCFIRVVRKMMMDKVVNSLTFFEMLLNPVNAPRLYMGFIKVMTSEDKKRIEKLYEQFGQISLDCMPLELNYSEKAEADMINKIFILWNQNKNDFLTILNKVAHPGDGNNLKKEKSYFG